MRVETVGDGPAQIAVVGGIHGDEPCGTHAVETLLGADLDLERAVKFIVANEEAIEQDTRYVDEDLNRAFPDDPDGVTHESRLAYRLGREVSDCQILALHSTQSYGGKFALVDRVGEFERRVCPHLSVDAIVETCNFAEGRLFEVTQRVVEVECGYQRSDTAAENAVDIALEFLTATGALPESAAATADGGSQARPIYRLIEQMPKTTAEVYEVFATNFAEVAAGQTYAAADEREYVADEPFYPVLLSAYGYEDVFGYAADRVGTMGE
ncbi:MAG: succinylglutamate desuccinylase/aspartoacylase family protein [Halorientalis sp.]